MSHCSLWLRLNPAVSGTYLHRAPETAQVGPQCGLVRIGSLAILLGSLRVDGFGLVNGWGRPHLCVAWLKWCVCVWVSAEG